MRRTWASDAAFEKIATAQPSVAVAERIICARTPSLQDDSVAVGDGDTGVDVGMHTVYSLTVAAGMYTGGPRTGLCALSWICCTSAAISFGV